MTDEVALDHLEEDEHERAWLHGRPFSGRATEFHANGVIASMTTYLEGYEEGTQRFWRPDGSLEMELTLHHGNAVGGAYSWHASGKLAQETLFDEQGHPRRRRSWDESGCLCEEYDWDAVYGA